METTTVYSGYTGNNGKEHGDYYIIVGYVLGNEGIY